MSSHYYKVTGKKLKELIIDFHDRKHEAINAGRRFSRRQGGHRDKIGVVKSWGHTNLAIVFKAPPDTAIWKKADRYSTEYWVPKRNRKSKAVLEEFEALEKAIPNDSEIETALDFNSFGGGDLRFYNVSMGHYDGTWVIALPGYYKPAKGIGLKRMSDIAFEKLADAA